MTAALRHEGPRVRGTAVGRRRYVDFVYIADRLVTPQTYGHTGDYAPETDEADPSYYIPLANLRDRTASLVLGEPGIGKSAALRQLLQAWSANGDVVELVDLRACSSARSVETAFEGLVASDARPLLLLDSVDEAPELINNFVSFLRKELTRLIKGGWRIIAACRTAESVPALDDLFEELQSQSAHVLLPLRRSDVASLATSMAIDPGVFQAEIARRRLDSLAAVPYTLHLLCEIYADDGSFPASRSDLFDRAIHLSLGQTSAGGYSPTTTPQLNPLRQLATAERLAGFSAFAGTTDYARYQPGTSSRGTPTELLAGTSPIEHRAVSLENADFQDVLLTPLFASSGANQSRFAHRRLRDFLAAKFLIRHDVSRAHLESILVVPDGEAIPPQMADVATWLVALERERFDWLVDLDPISLVRNKIALDVPELASTLVSLLLQRAATVERAVTWRDELSGLEHPTLAAQLADALQGGDEIERTVALRLLRDSYVAGLEDQLVSIVSDRTAPSRLRELAASVVVRQQLARRLNPEDLVSPDFFANDSNAELRGLLLRALWPEAMTPPLVEALLVPPPEHYVGSYSLFLSSFGDSLTPDYAEAVLRWALARDALDRRGWSSRGSVKWLVDNALAMRIRSMHDGGDVPTDAAAALRALLATGNRKLPFVRSELSETNRRTVIRALALLFASDELGWYRLQAARDADGALLIDREDLPWLLDVAQEVADLERTLWARLIDRFLDSERAGDMELVWALQGTSLWSHFRYRFDAIPLDSDIASRGREQMREDNDELSEAQDVRAASMSADDYTHGIRERLAETRADTTRFWDLARWLDVDLEHRQFRFTFTPDLLATDASRHLDEATRTEIRELAARFLTDPHAKPLPEPSPNEISFGALASYQALHTLSKHEASALDRLSAEDWWRANTPILEFPTAGAEADLRPELLQRSFENNPDAIRHAVHEHLRRVSRGGSLSNYLEGLAPYADTSMIPALQTGVRTQSATRRDLLDIYLRVDRSGALAWMLRRIKRSNTPAELAVIIEMSLRDSAADGIRLLELLVAERPETAQAALPLFAQMERFDTVPLTAVDVASRVRVFEAVSRLFPREDESFPDGIHSVEPREDLAEWRDQILSGVVREGTRESLAAVIPLAERMPDAVSDLAVIRAREAYRISGWFPLTVLELHTLIERTDARLIRSSRDAKFAVMDALDEIAEWLRGETPQAFALWNVGTNYACPKDENRISDWYCHGLRLLLARSGLVINREVEVVNVSGRGAGRRNDIRVEVRDPDNGSMYTVVVEVKGIWNQGVKSSLRTQLADEYLTRAGLTHGVYLVVSFPPSQITVAPKAAAARLRSKGLRQHLELEASSLGPSLDVSAVIHNAGMPT